MTSPTIPEPLASKVMVLQLFGRKSPEDRIEVALEEMGHDMTGHCTRLSKYSWRIVLNKIQAEFAPTMAGHALVHEWAHYLAADDPRHSLHLGAWAEAHAKAFRLAFRLTA